MKFLSQGFQKLQHERDRQTQTVSVIFRQHGRKITFTDTDRRVRTHFYPHSREVIQIGKLK